MHQAGKIRNAIQEMAKIGIDIMGISEMRWPGSGTFTTGEYKIFYSGNEDNQHRYRVGMVLSREMQKYITNFVPISERIMAIKLKSTPVNLNIIQTYAPTTDKSDEEIEQFYKALTDTLK